MTQKETSLTATRTGMSKKKWILSNKHGRWAFLFAFMLGYLQSASVAKTATNPEGGWVADRLVAPVSLVHSPVTLSSKMEQRPLKLVSANNESPKPSGINPTRMSLATSPAEITPEITSLTRSVINGPGLGAPWQKIFLFVKNQLGYEHYYGCKKGAALTLLEGKGNDADLATVLVAMLRAADYQAKYKFGLLYIPGDSHPNGFTMANWLGVETNRIAGFNATRGFPNTFIDNQGNLGIHRTWVEVFVGSKWEPLDPAFKKRVRVVPAIDAATASGYSREALKQAAGGTITQNAIEGLDVAALGAYLTQRSAALVSELEQNHHGTEAGRLIGGWRFEPFIGSDGNERQFFGGTNGIIQTWDDLPNWLLAKLTLEVRDQAAAGSPIIASAQMATALLQGSRLSLTFTSNDSNGRAQLWLDDTLLSEEGSGGSGTKVQLRIIIDQPHTNVLGQTLHDQASEKEYRRGANYALPYAFNPSSALLHRRQEALDAYRRSGLAETSRQVVTETLNVLGLTWFHQTELTFRVIAGMLNCDPTYHHRFGRVGQEDGYYIDVDLQFTAFFSLNVENSLGDEIGVARSFFKSAMEHGVIEQLQGATNQSVSTVKLIHLANQQAAGSGKIFYATQSNWSSVQTGLQGYSGGDLSRIQNAIDQGGQVLLPQKGNITLNQWTGAGYVSRVTTENSTTTTMGISGGLNGGYGSRLGQVSPRSIAALANSNPLRVNSNPILNPRTLGVDPVDLASGDYFFKATHLEMGELSPRGFSFVTVYHGGRRWVNPSGLGYGWTHNWDTRLARRSAYEPALGVGGTPYDVASAMVAVLASVDILSGEANAQHWTLAALVAQWFTDQLQDNAVSVSLGDRALQFIRRPDGSWQPPGGVASTLTSSGTNWVLQERHGNSFRFNGQRLAEVEDLWGKKLTLAYNPSNQVASLSNTYGRSLTFNYTGGRLASVTDSGNRSVQFAHDTNANLITIIDPEDKADRFVYDSDHRITEVRNHDNEILVINIYDAAGDVIEQLSHGDTNRTYRCYYGFDFSTEEDPAGNRTHHFFDEKRRQVGRQDALNRTWTTGFDGQDRAIVMKTPLMNIVARAYDRFQNVLTNTVFDGTNSFTEINFYDPLHRLSKTLDPLGHPTAFGYNPQHQVLAMTNAKNEVIQYSYNPSGTCATTTDPDEKTVHYFYNSQDELIETLYPNGDRRSVRRNIFGDPESVTDARTNTTTITYNRRRQVLTSTAPGNLITSNTYNNSRWLASTTDPRTNTTFYSYSVTGKLLITTLPDSSQIIDTYDSRDWLVNRRNQLNQTNIFICDAVGQVREQKDPLNRLTTFFFDADGRQTHVVNHLGQTNAQTYNGRGLVTTTTDPLTQTSTNIFDAGGRPTAFINRRNKTYRFTFDELDRQLAIITPNNRTNSQSWNNRGAIASVTEPSGETTFLGYDARGRETNRNDAGGTITRILDGNNNVLSITQGGITITRTFDLQNRVLTYNDGRGHILAYGYDANGNLTSLTYEPGKTVAYTYDSRNRLRTITDWTGRITTLDYDAADRLITITRPNGTRRDYTWDAGGQLIAVNDRHVPSGLPVVGLRVAYDQAGRLRYKLELPTWPQASVLPARNVSYNPDNQIIEVNGLAIGHDLDGNVTNAPAPRGGASFVSYAFNARNQLTNGPDGLSYSYDAEGHRTSLSTNGQVTIFVNDPHGALSRMLIRQRPDGSRTFYVYGPVLLYEIEETNNAARQYHYDHFGSTIALTDDTGQVTGRATYSAYGLTVQTNGTLNTPFLWQGAFGVQTDSNGLLYMRARYYHAYLGRFLSEDPFGLSAGPNVYSYANGNPITAHDPSGNIVETPWDVFNVGLGITSLGFNLWNGNFGAAALDVAGLAYDTLATAVPLLPAGASTALKAGRVGNSVVHLASGAAEVAQVGVQANKVVGLAAEAKVAENVIAQGHTILGSHVAANTAEGRRVIDHLIQTSSGDVLAVEVKSGNAVRSTSQLRKDSSMASEGAVLVGKNAPSSLKGQPLNIQTIEVRKRF